MSLPAPLPYEPRRFGSQREAPAKGAGRPYAQRLALAGKLVEETKVGPSEPAAWLPTFAQVALVVGALAPFALAIPGIGSLFIPLLVSTYPASAGLLYATLWLMSGWAGAALVAVAGALGLMAAGVGGEAASKDEARRQRTVRVLAVGILGLITVGACWALGWLTAFGGSAGAVWVAVTAAAGLWGARQAARRENWTGALLGAVALIAGGRVIIGSIALVALVLSDKAFPGQKVALYPWSRSQVSLDPPEPAAALAPVQGEEVFPPARPPHPQSLFVAAVCLLFGAFAPFVMALPWFGIELFGGLILAVWPASVFILWTGAAVQGAFAALFHAGELGAMVPGAVLILLWLLVVPAAGAIIAGRAVASRTRRWAAVAGAVLLIVGGRPLFGAGALVAVGYAWPLFDQRQEGVEPPKERAPGASAH